MKKTFINKTNSGVTSMQTSAFFIALAAIQCKTNPYQSPGARRLFPIKDLLIAAVRSNPRIKSHELISIVKSMPASPLHGISDNTAKIYMSQARTEFNINSYSSF